MYRYLSKFIPQVLLRLWICNTDSSSFNVVSTPSNYLLVPWHLQNMPDSRGTLRLQWQRPTADRPQEGAALHQHWWSRQQTVCDTAVQPNTVTHTHYVHNNLYSSGNQKCFFFQLLSLFIVLISKIILWTDYFTWFAFLQFSCICVFICMCSNFDCMSFV